MRRLTLSIVSSLMLAVTALPAAARAEGGCGNGKGWHLAPAEPAVFADYPSIQRAIAEDVYSFADLVAQLEARDKNENGWLCVKDVYAWSVQQSDGANSQSKGFYFYVNAVDDNPAAR